MTATKEQHKHSHGSADWAGHAAASIQAAGHRRSNARDEVVGVLARQDCVLSAREITDQLRSEGSDIGVATVYRALELLEELKLIQRIDVGQGTARFEAALPDGDHHHHLVCDNCEQLVPFEDKDLEQAIDKLAGRLDLKVTGHDIVLRGECTDCAD